MLGHGALGEFALGGTAEEITGTLSGVEGADSGVFTGTSGAVVTPAPTPSFDRAVTRFGRGRPPRSLLVNAVIKSAQGGQFSQARGSVAWVGRIASRQEPQTSEGIGSVSVDAIGLADHAPQTSKSHGRVTMRATIVGKQVQQDNIGAGDLALTVVIKSGVVVLPVPKYHGDPTYGFSYRPPSDVDQAA